MSFVQSLINRVALLSARTKILQDKIAGGGIQRSLDLIDSKFSTFGLDSAESKSLFEQAKESNFRRIELEKLGADQDLIDDAAFEESDRFERFRDSYGT